MLPEHPVDALTLAIVRAVAGAADHCEAPFMIVGAAARDIILENVHGIAPRRATRDVDFAFALESWVEFDRLKTRLCETGTFEADPDTQHRLFFGPGAGGSDGKRPGGFAVDIVPFGTIAGADNTLAWPPGLDLLMNLAGDAEAMESACSVQLAPDLTIRVASLPGLALMKLFAWSDRGAANSHDAEDLLQLLQNYERAGNADRIYDDECAEILEEVEHDPTRTGAWLPGADAGRLATAETLALALRILNLGRNVERLATVMSRSLATRPDPFEHARELLELFRRGVEASTR